MRFAGGQAASRVAMATFGESAGAVEPDVKVIAIAAALAAGGGGCAGDATSSDGRGCGGDGGGSGGPHEEYEWSSGGHGEPGPA